MPCRGTGKDLPLVRDHIGTPLLVWAPSAHILVLVRARSVPSARDVSMDEGQGRNWERTTARRSSSAAHHATSAGCFGHHRAQLAMAVSSGSFIFSRDGHPQRRSRRRRPGAAGADGLICTRPGTTSPSGARSGPVDVAPSGRGPTTRCRPRVIRTGGAELQRRMWWLHDNGGRVILVAHSQGAVLATRRSSARLPSGRRPPGADHVRLTGVQALRLGFPAYFDHDLLGRLSQAVPGS